MHTTKQNTGSLQTPSATPPPSWEVLSLVADHIDPKSLARASCVNKTWNRIMSSDHLWKKLCIKYYPIFTSERFESTGPATSYRRIYAAAVTRTDKWRNINVTAIWGSRQKAKLALKKNQLALKKDDSPLALTAIPHSDVVVADVVEPLAISGAPLLLSPGSKEPPQRLENLILEALSHLKEPGGSDRASIILFIEEKYCAPQNLRKLLTAKLKHLIENGTLLKDKHKYMLAPISANSEVRKRSPVLLLEGRAKESPKAHKKVKHTLTRPEVDSELLKIRGMTIEQATAAAAQALAEAEFAIAEAEQAAKDAEAAESKAEAAQIFAKAAKKALKCGTVHVWRLRLLIGMSEILVGPPYGALKRLSGINDQSQRASGSLPSKELVF
ncbi:hypothetical protein ACFE04_023419 [Oxalis oulophora]